MFKWLTQVSTTCRSPAHPQLPCHGTGSFNHGPLFYYFFYAKERKNCNTLIIDRYILYSKYFIIIRHWACENVNSSRKGKIINRMRRPLTVESFPRKNISLKIVLCFLNWLEVLGSHVGENRVKNFWVVAIAAPCNETFMSALASNNWEKYVDMKFRAKFVGTRSDVLLTEPARYLFLACFTRRKRKQFHATSFVKWSSNVLVRSSDGGRWQRITCSSNHITIRTSPVKKAGPCEQRKRMEKINPMSIKRIQNLFWLSVETNEPADDKAL